MTKFFCLFLIFALLFTCSSCEKSDNQQKYAVQITVKSDNVLTHASGVIVNGYVITAAHIFDGTNPSEVICTAGNSQLGTYPCNQIFIDVNNDVAALSWPYKDGIKISKYSSKSIKNYYIIYDEKHIKCDIFNMVKTDAVDKPDRLIKIDAFLDKGYSGAPLIDEYGYLYGMVVARDKNGESSYAISKEIVLELLEKINR